MSTRTALVIGGSSGIGLATAQILARQGATIHVVGRDPGKLEAASRENAELVGHQADGTVREQLEEVLDQIGTIDWLILAMSGATGAGRVAELDLDELRGAFEAKLFGHLTAVQAALPHLSGDGSITFVSAISARTGIAATAGLAAVNGAVESLVKPLAVELAPVRVNAVSPGLVDTPWWSGLPAEQRAAYFAQSAEALPVKQIGRADDVAQAVVTAATNPNITGTVIECDGGARLVTLA
jgi:NAD(P)-dependent dehydrogenase (short-subunit alcohol dehydrogenase family)